MDINDIATILMINGSRNYDIDTKEYHILNEFVDDMSYIDELNEILYDVGYGIYFNETENSWNVVDMVR